MGAYDMGVLLGNRGIAVRSGAHCAYALMERMGKESICRVSLGFYNTVREIQEFVQAVKDLQKKFDCPGRGKRGA